MRGVRFSNDSAAPFGLASLRKSNMEKITGEITIQRDENSEIEKETKNISDFKKKIEKTFSLEATEILKILLGGALFLRASDIHIEPMEEKAKIRIRIDGILQDIVFLPQKIYSLLLSRIKLLAGIKLNIADKPQDGRFALVLENLVVPKSSEVAGLSVKQGLDIEIRVSTLPAEYGESIVLRILNPKSLISLEDLGLREDLLKTFEAEIKKPNGMIIVTGPTGSGKTTTLYSFLKKLQKPEIKIITIEDPIEYKLEGISQTQVDESKGYNFANGLRSIMRQDPDVILVGEIRDFDTAQIALQAALTGHLVLSTLHTNDAAGTISRLVDLGVSPTSIAPALNMIVAQRLVRKVCKKCTKLTSVSREVFEKIKKGLGNLPKNLKMPALSKSLKIPQAKGCKFCNQTGYQDRIGIFETFLVDEELEKLILSSPSISEIKEGAIKKGMTTMYQDGLIKVIEGITTLEEVERVVAE